MTEDEQEHDRTISVCTERLDVCPDDVIALTNRGRAWYEKENYDNVIVDFGQALSANADRPDAPNIYICAAHYGRGLVSSERGDHDLAIRDFTEGVGQSYGQGEQAGRPGRPACSWLIDDSVDIGGDRLEQLAGPT